MNLKKIRQSSVGIVISGFLVSGLIAECDLGDDFNLLSDNITGHYSDNVTILEFNSNSSIDGKTLTLNFKSIDRNFTSNNLSVELYEVGDSTPKGKDAKTLTKPGVDFNLGKIPCNETYRTYCASTDYQVKVSGLSKEGRVSLVSAEVGECEKTYSENTIDLIKKPSISAGNSYEDSIMSSRVSSESGYADSLVYFTYIDSSFKDVVEISDSKYVDFENLNSSRTYSLKVCSVLSDIYDNDKSIYENSNSILCSDVVSATTLTPEPDYEYSENEDGSGTITYDNGVSVTTYEDGTKITTNSSATSAVLGETKISEIPSDIINIEKDEDSGTLEAEIDIDEQNGDGKGRSRVKIESNGEIQKISILNSSGEMMEMNLPSGVETDITIKEIGNKKFLMLKLKTQTKLILNTKVTTDRAVEIEGEEISVEPIGSWSRFEQTIAADGYRTIKLTTGSADLTVDGETQEMSKDVEYQLPPLQPTGEIEEIEDTVDDNSSKTISLNGGWNLVALPTDSGLSDFTKFEDYSVIWKYSNQEWQKNPNSIDSGEGFWILVDELTDRDITFEGSSYSPNLDSLDGTWQLLGTGEVIENIVESESIEEAYKYSRDWIKNPETINSGEGFWVK